jgi:hypothetical protein
MSIGQIARNCGALTIAAIWAGRSRAARQIQQIGQNKRFDTAANGGPQEDLPRHEPVGETTKTQKAKDQRQDADEDEKERKHNIHWCSQNVPTDGRTMDEQRSLQGVMSGHEAVRRCPATREVVRAGSAAGIGHRAIYLG